MVTFLQYVSTIVPPSSLGVSRISLYFFLIGLLCMFSLIGNVIVLNLHNRDIRIANDMPKWCENFICFLARLLRMKKIDFKNEIKNFDENESLEGLKSIDSEMIKKIIKTWNEMNEKLNEDSKVLKWKYAAIVMDRLFFILSVTYFLITFLSFFLIIKNSY